MIKEKKCTKCKKVKPLIEFYTQKANKDEFSFYCKTCINIKNKEYKRTKKGLITKIYSTQKRKSKLRRYKMPTYTKQELTDWLFSQKLFHELFDNWKRSAFDTMLSPSCDRIDDYTSYTLANIQLMTWKENLDKAHLDFKEGRNNKLSKAVLQFTLGGEFIKEYHSISEAERFTKIFDSNISSCCLGKSKTAGGYIWRHKNN